MNYSQPCSLFPPLHCQVSFLKVCLFDGAMLLAEEKTKKNLV